MLIVFIALDWPIYLCVFNLLWNWLVFMGSDRKMFELAIKRLVRCTRSTLFEHLLSISSRYSKFNTPAFFTLIRKLLFNWVIYERPCIVLCFHIKYAFKLLYLHTLLFRAVTIKSIVRQAANVIKYKKQKWNENHYYIKPLL